MAIIEVTAKQIPANAVGLPRRWVVWFWRVQNDQRQDAYESIVMR